MHPCRETKRKNYRLFGKQLRLSGDAVISKSDTALLSMSPVPGPRFSTQGDRDQPANRRNALPAGALLAVPPLRCGLPHEQSTGSPRNTFDFVLANPDLEYKILGPPKMAVSDRDFLIGLYISTLARDGDELQVGIGAIGDALVYPRKRSRARKRCASD